MKYALANMLNGYGVRGLDPDAKAYIDAVIAAGATVTSTQRNAINAFVKGGKTDGWWVSMKRIYLPIWAIAAPNAIDIVSGTSGTFAGTVTHAAGYVQGNGTTGLFRFNGTPSSLGLTNASGFLFTLCNQAMTATGSHIGVLQGTTNRCTITSSGTLAIAAEFIVSGTAAITGNTVPLANQNGVLCFSRTSTTSLTLYQRKTASGLVTLATNTSTESGSSPTESVCAMARGRTSTTADSYTNGRHGAYGVGLGMPQSDVSNMTLAVKNLWETCTGLTLP
jgi:hypothetical protein